MVATQVPANEESRAGRVILFSFGFKYGDPTGINMLLDVRLLPNPYWEDALRDKSGKQPEVADYVLKSQEGERFFQLLEPLYGMIIDQQVLTGGKNMRLAVGCTGGRHRSVAVVEKLALRLREKGVHCEVFHRDIERDLKG